LLFYFTCIVVACINTKGLKCCILVFGAVVFLLREILYTFVLSFAIYYDYFLFNINFIDNIWEPHNLYYNIRIGRLANGHF